MRHFSHSSRIWLGDHGLNSTIGNRSSSITSQRIVTEELQFCERTSIFFTFEIIASSRTVISICIAPSDTSITEYTPLTLRIFSDSADQPITLVGGNPVRVNTTLSP